MTPTYAEPAALVEALHARQSAARRELQALFRDPIKRLMEELLAKAGSKEDPTLVVDHAMQLAETIVRYRPKEAFAGVTWQAFRAGLLMQVAKVAMQPYGGGGTNGHAGPGPLPPSDDYHHEMFYRPYARMGKHFFGGDYYAGRLLGDGSFWVFLADVTGHGYYAYLLASALPAVWARCWAKHPGTPPEPAELLTVMHDLLSDVLPDGIFLESTLTRLAPDGTVTVCPAGGTRLLVFDGDGPIDLLKLRGSWLGLRPPDVDEQHTFRLERNAEILLATDGLYDQLDDHGGAEEVARSIATRTGAMFHEIRGLLEKALQTDKQKDDITMVLLRRRLARAEDRLLGREPTE